MKLFDFILIYYRIAYMLHYSKINHQIIRITPQNDVADQQIALNFLNPLCCNQLTENNLPRLAAILNIKGIIQASFFAFAKKNNPTDIFLQSPHGQILGSLLAHYKLASAIKITKTTDIIYALWHADADGYLPEIATPDEVTLLPDPRNTQTDAQICYLIGAPEQCADFINAQHGWQMADADKFTYRRSQLGLPDDEYANHEFLPQHLHFDRLAGIDFHKGCYPGQEICARIHFKGKVKRKLFALILDENLSTFDATDIYNDKAERVGEIISHVKTVETDAPQLAWGYINCQSIDEEQPLLLEGYNMTPIIPSYYQRTP